MKFKRFLRRHVRRKKHISACKRASEASALQQAAILLKQMTMSFV
jgi:hypothetical protein